MSEPAPRSTGPHAMRTEKMNLDAPLDARFAPGGSRDPRRSTSMDAPTDPQEGPSPGSRLARLAASLRGTLHTSIWLPSRVQVVGIVCLASALLMWRNLERPLEVHGSDRALVLTVDDLVGLSGAGELDPDLERFTKVARLGGAVELEYDYQPGDAGPRLAFVTRFHRGESAAKDDFTLTNVQTMIDWKLDGRGGIGLVALENLEDWADQMRAFRVEAAGKTIGYSFAARVGDRTVYMALEDVALNEPAAIEQLLGSVLDTVETSPRPR